MSTPQRYALTRLGDKVLRTGYLLWDRGPIVGQRFHLLYNEGGGDRGLITSTVATVECLKDRILFTTASGSTYRLEPVP